MNAESLTDSELDTDDDFDDNDAEEPDSIVAENTDNVGDPSVEINIEELLSELESDGLIADCASEDKAKRRLEDLMEQRRARQALEDFDDYDV